MGLATPVCAPCRRIMAWHGDEPHWRCPGCGKTADAPTGVTHLFCMPPDEAEELMREQWKWPEGES